MTHKIRVDGGRLDSIRLGVERVIKFKPPNLIMSIKFYIQRVQCSIYILYYTLYEIIIIMHNVCNI